MTKSELVSKNSKVLHAIRQYKKELDEIRTRRSRYATDIKTTIDNLVAKEATDAFEKMPISAINFNRAGIRVSALEKAGIHTIGRLDRYSESQLLNIRGIGQDSVYSILNNLKELRRRAQQSSKLSFNINEVGAYDKYHELMREIYVYRNSRDFEKEADALLTQIGDLEIDVEENGKKLGFFSWLFMNDGEKSAVEQSVLLVYEFYEQIFEPYYRQFADENRKFLATATQNGWIEFHDNLAGCYTVIDNITNSRTTAPMAGKLVNGVELDRFIEQINKTSVDLSLMRTDLRRYQEFGVKFNVSQKRTLLGDEMGLGKTIQAIATIAHLNAIGKKKALVCCPLSVLINWEREIHKHSSLRVVRIYGESKLSAYNTWLTQDCVGLTTYETLSKYDFTRKGNLDILVVDEAHNVKHSTARRTQLVVQLANMSEYVLYMTGTPMENNPKEMKYLISCLQPNVAIRLESLLENSEQFKRAVVPVYLRRTREDVLKELPELIDIEDWLEMNSYEQTKYIQSLQSESFMQVRRISWNVDNAHSGKLEKLIGLCDDAREEGRKVLVFSFFRDTMEMVRLALGEHCIGEISGDVSVEERQRLIDRLGQAPVGSVLVSQITAGGLGLNIQAASVIIICEPQYKPSTENQAIARSYRMGQTRNVIVHRLLMKDTVDERLMEVLKQKSELFDAFADVSEVGDRDFKINKSVMADIIKQECKKYEVVRVERDDENGE